MAKLGDLLTPAKAPVLLLGEQASYPRGTDRNPGPRGEGKGREGGSSKQWQTFSKGGGWP
jgi:hypothetical protein